MRPLLFTSDWDQPFFGSSRLGGGGGVGGLSRFNTGNNLRRPVHFEVRETDKEVVVQAETPGYHRDSLSVDVEDGRLIIRGSEQKGEEGSEYFEREEFTQAFQIPPELEHSHMDATYKDGMLRITLQKPEPVAPKKKSVAIGDGGSGQQKHLPVGGSGGGNGGKKNGS